MKNAALLALVLFAVPACIIPGSTTPAGGGTYAGGGGGGGGGMPNGGGGAGGDPNASGEAPPQGPVSVEIHSSCPDTVPVFYGTDPGYGSGTESSVESNSIETQSFNPGEQMWIVDGSEHGITSVTVGPDTHHIEIGADCASLQAQ